MTGEKAYKTGREFFKHMQCKAALTCFEQAAVEQYPGAYVWLGYLYQIGGLIGPKNFEVSKEWYGKTRTQLDWFKDQAKGGQPNIQSDLGLYYENCFGIDNDLQQAVHYYQLAAEHGDGDARAQRNLGICYEVGCGVDRDLHQAAHYYRLAAEQEDIAAKIRLESLLTTYS